MDIIHKSVLNVVTTFKLSIDSENGWTLYKLEDGRYAVSKFDFKGRQEDEEIFQDPEEAVTRFLILADVADW